MESSKPSKVEFHPDAVARFTQVAQEILASVGSFGSSEIPQPIRNAEIHPIVSIPAADIIGEIKVQQSSFNVLNEEMGRYWDSKGLKVGWEGAEFERLKGLARKFESTEPLKGRVSHKFLLDEVFKWSQETLERQRNDTLTDYIAERCSNGVKVYEIWIPVYRTYSAEDFAIGSVEFRTISKAMLDQWFSRIPEQDLESKPEMAVAINRERAAIQGGIAASVKVTAELDKAREIAHAAASEAIGLLRFLSPVNWTCRLVSHCLPVGRENTQQTMELFIIDGAIQSMSKASVEQGPPAWNIDEARARLPGHLEALNNLASHRDATPFSGDLYGALQLYSRHSVAVEISHKIVFVTAAIESLLLKDSNEPIQKNLGERMAFLIGNSLQERKAIIDNTDNFYRIRSGFIHHGRDVSPEDKEIIDKFFFNVWVGFSQLLSQRDKYRTRQDLLTELENRKLS